MIIPVVCAVIIKNRQVLCAQRGLFMSLPLKWEFPGGKVEDGETYEEALIREIKEELNLIIDVRTLFLSVDHTYPDFNLSMHSYLCSAFSGELILKEHQQSQWLYVNELDRLDWAAADIPIVKKLKESLKDAHIL